MRNSLTPLTLISFLLTACVTAQPTVDTQVRVVGEDGNPIEGARVGIGFPGVTVTSGWGFWERTDSAGLATASGEVPFGVMLTIQKKGYYVSKVDRYYGDRDAPKWNREVVLREIRTPIPMYAKHFSAKIPNSTEPIGFDFETGDWVSPHGSGTQPDLLFNLSRNIESRQDYRTELNIMVPKGQGGIQKFEENRVWQESEFKTPYMAPDTGYARSYQAVRARKDDRASNTDEDGAVFIIQSRGEEGQNSRIQKAHYTKITDFLLSTGLSSGQAGVRFTYHFNPARDDRNLEFNVDRNLFRGLEREEEVEKP